MPRAVMGLSRRGGEWLASVILLLHALCDGAGAQAPSTQVGVLRATAAATPVEVANEVDAALLRDLAALAGLDQPVVPPVDFADVQLGVGCQDESRACLEAIAHAVQVDTLVIRTLAVEADRARLTLLYFEAASTAEPTRVTWEGAGESELVAAVPGLVRELFKIPEVAEPAEAPVTQGPEAATQTRNAPVAEERGVSALTWILLGSGAVVLGSGIALGWTAENDFDAWKREPIGTPQEAREAREALADMEARGVAANVLMPVGAVVLGLGLTSLLFESFESEPEQARAALRVGATAGRDGAALQVSGQFGGAL